jgi:pimeloyl-ACP methyl ester carboxylesterase
MPLRFGPFRLDTQERRLHNGDAEVSLAPKAFDLLAYLASHPSNLCTRDELFNALWPDTFVDDHALSVQIADIRRALGDSPRGATYIETRSRRGYCFIAPVTQTEIPAPSAPAKIPETHYTLSGDVNIAYQVLGDGPIDIVFVMGWVSHLEYFWREPRFAAFLHRLASMGRLILFDKRGTGLSDRVPLSRLPTLEERMDDVRAVMEAAGSQRAVLCGVSEGGPMSCLFAATYPQKTTGLVMIGSYARRLRDADYPWGPTREERDAYCAEIRHHWGGPVGIEDRAPSLAADTEFRDWWATYLRMGVSPGAAEALTRMNADIDVRPILPSIQSPTLVLHRADDRCLLADEGRYLASKIPAARFVLFPGPDHLPFAGNQSEILDEIQSFLAALEHAAEPDRFLATVLAAEPAAGASAADALHREVFRFHGNLLSDSPPLALFDGPARAIRCAESLVHPNAGLAAFSRAALHTGECDHGPAAAAGLTSSLATRILAQTPPAGVLVSRVVKDLVAGSGIRFSEHAPFHCAELSESWPLYRVDSLR